jgi:hypothetical protein
LANNAFVHGSAGRAADRPLHSRLFVAMLFHIFTFGLMIAVAPRWTMRSITWKVVVFLRHLAHG